MPAAKEEKRLGTELLHRARPFSPETNRKIAESELELEQQTEALPSPSEKTEPSLTRGRPRPAVVAAAAAVKAATSESEAQLSLDQLRSRPMGGRAGPAEKVQAQGEEAAVESRGPYDRVSSTRFVQHAIRASRSKQ
ncbi:Protein of unknown function [Gryllus bimaculatus]|nr:Protein of unknown function [Gryllus bimaculatus]